MKIYLITKDGPEWQVPIEAHTDEILADARCKELDSTLDKNEVFDCISSHQVTVIELHGTQDCKSGKQVKK